jgi:hypothetical protein
MYWSQFSPDCCSVLGLLNDSAGGRLNEQGGAYAMEMKPFPVVRVHRTLRGQELIFHCAMIECETAEEAVAAYKPEPGDRVEFAGWDVPRKLEQLATADL